MQTDRPVPADRTSLCELKARYCRYVDAKRWEDLRTLFTPDARFEGLGSVRQGGSLDEFIAGIATRLGPAVSVHHCHMPEFRFLDADHARGIWAMMDYVQWPPGTPVQEVPGYEGFWGYGHYEEAYRRDDGRWRIALLRLTRLRFDGIRAGHPAPRPGRLSLSPDWLDSLPAP